MRADFGRSGLLIAGIAQRVARGLTAWRPTTGLERLASKISALVGGFFLEACGRACAGIRAAEEPSLSLPPSRWAEVASTCALYREETTLSSTSVVGGGEASGGVCVAEDGPSLLEMTSARARVHDERGKTRLTEGTNRSENIYLQFTMWPGRGTLVVVPTEYLSITRVELLREEKGMAMFIHRVRARDKSHGTGIIVGMRMIRSLSRCRRVRTQ